MAIQTFVPSAGNPTKLSARYEIRQLTPAEIPWAAAIVCHSNTFYSPVWTVAYTSDHTARIYKMHAVCDYLIRHQVNSGMSFGIFDLEYKFKRPESAATGGKLYWDENNLEAGKEELLEQMDFPLASVALAYDGINEMDMPRMMPLIELLPLFGTIYGELAARDQRDPAEWKPKGHGEVLMRGGTSTRGDYEGKGLMKKLAHWVMREVDGRGYRGIQIECAHDAVNHVWLNPPKPFRGELISSLDTAEYWKEDEEGKKVKPFGEAATQVVTKIYVTLVSFLSEPA